MVGKLEHQNEVETSSKTRPIRHNMPTYLSDALFRQSQNVCSSASLSPHVLFMGRPLAPSESLDKSSERFLSSFSHIFAHTKRIKWTVIEENFPFLGKQPTCLDLYTPSPFFFMVCISEIWVFPERLLMQERTKHATSLLMRCYLSHTLFPIFVGYLLNRQQS